MTALVRFVIVLWCAQLVACAHLGPAQQARAHDYAEAFRSADVTCAQPCTIASPLRDLGAAAYAQSTDEQPKHTLVLLDHGQDSLLARVHLIRSAQHSIDLQTFHFERDDAGRIVLEELRQAARRGVHVRLLMDQLGGLADPEFQAELASFHRNLDFRVYNPLYRQARLRPMDFFGAVIFHFRDLNRRMHNKLMLIDDTVAVIGGRNIQDEYFDWNRQYNYRDRDLLVAGPATAAMKKNFDAFWSDRRSIPVDALVDVAQVLLKHQGPPSIDNPTPVARVKAMSLAAGNGEAVFARLQPYLYQVGAVDYLADLPTKHDDATQARSEASQALYAQIKSAQQNVLLQTPYLVLSRPARQLMRSLHRRPQPVRVRVSTNSLAATDAFPAYAMSHKYKRLYLRELGFEIHEFKPFPLDAPIDLAATGAIAGPDPISTIEMPGSYGSGRRPVPLKRAGVRIGLHAKSMVIDGDVAIIGSHNFDPRSSDFNTESLVIVHDAVFAAALSASIERDMTPENAWMIAPRPSMPALAYVNYNLGKLSEKLPVFDLWPFPYATSYELKPGCTPLSPSNPAFSTCYEAVGDFPEVDLGLKAIYTRIMTVFGAGFIPFL